MHVTSSVWQVKQERSPQEPRRGKGNMQLKPRGNQKKRHSSWGRAMETVQPPLGCCGAKRAEPKRPYCSHAANPMCAESDSRALRRVATAPRPSCRAEYRGAHPAPMRVVYAATGDPRRAGAPPPQEVMVARGARARQALFGPGKVPGPVASCPGNAPKGSETHCMGAGATVHPPHRARVQRGGATPGRASHSRAQDCARGHSRALVEAAPFQSN